MSSSAGSQQHRLRGFVPGRCQPPPRLQALLELMLCSCAEERTIKHVWAFQRVVCPTRGSWVWAQPVPGRCSLLRDAGMRDAERPLPCFCLQPACLLPSFHPTGGSGALCLPIYVTIPLSCFKKSCNIHRDPNKATDGWRMITALWFCAHDNYSATKILILCYTECSFISSSLAATPSPVLVKFSIRGSYRAIY